MTEHLTLPVNGKDYTVPSPPARVGLALQASHVIRQAVREKREIPPYAVERAARYDDMTHSLDEDSLGPAWEQMIADDVPLSELRLAAAAAYVWIVTGNAESARAVMTGEPVGGGSGPKASTTTAAASTTKPPASTSGTTSRRKKSKG